MEIEKAVLGGDRGLHQKGRDIREGDPAAAPSLIRESLAEQGAVSVEDSERDDRLGAEAGRRESEKGRGGEDGAECEGEREESPRQHVSHFPILTTPSALRPKTSGAYICAAFVPG